MGRQIHIHATPADINSLVVGLGGTEIEIALQRGNASVPEKLAFIPASLSGETFVFWSERFAPELRRDFVAAQPPYYLVHESSEAVLQTTLSAFMTWNGRRALRQGRIYGIFQDKSPEFEKWYERIVRYIRRHWRKNPVAWMGGYIGPQAWDWFEQGGLLLPNHVPPVRSSWIALLSDQHAGLLT